MARREGNSRELRDEVKPGDYLSKRIGKDIDNYANLMLSTKTNLRKTEGSKFRVIAREAVGIMNNQINSRLCCLSEFSVNFPSSLKSSKNAHVKR